ncbi:MAG: hypothetical protein O6947_04820 [Acidobacteria bacterium]|nr:hypothetical protein [Acidobacteriota bacterium]
MALKIAVGFIQTEGGPHLAAWPFVLGIAIWLAIVLIHGFLKVRKGHPTITG